MKHLTALLLTTMMSLTLWQCGGPGNSGTSNFVEFNGSGDTTSTTTPTPDTVTITDAAADSSAGHVGIDVRHVGQFDRVFNDSNHVHLAEATRIGIEPLTDTRSFWHMRRPLVKIETNPDFVLDNLTHSQPYLIPEAAEMAHEIGRRFRDSLSSRGAGDYRIKITSVLRTPDGVRRLRRVNRNAVEASVHQMGTTIDITYATFVPAPGAPLHRTEQLKAVLAEVLAAMRSEGKLWVKYEKQQPCFHITVRKPDNQS